MKQSLKRSFCIFRRLWIFGLIGLFLCEGCTLRSEKQNIQIPVKQFYVDDFGAVPNDGKDDGVAVRKAIDAAITSGKRSVVVFRSGVYHIAPASGDENTKRGAALWIRDAMNLSLRGSGEKTTLIFTNPMVMGVRFDRCHNVLISDLRLDWDPLPYAFGTVVTMSEGGFELELDPRSISLDHIAFANAEALWGIAVRWDELHKVTHYGPHVIRPEDKQFLQNRRWYMKGIIGKGQLQAGSGFVYMPRINDGAVSFWHCVDICAERVVILASPGVAFLPILSKNVSFIDCHVSVAKGRMLSTNADGIHARSLRGTIQIEECSFEGMADDAINIHSSAILVQQVVSPTEILARNSTWSLQPGDKLVVMDAHTLDEKGRTTVAVTESGPAVTRIRFTEPIDGIIGGKSYADADRIYNLSEAGSPFVIKSCVFGAFRGRGILACSIGGVIEQNVFVNNEGWGLDLAFGERIWGEGPPPQNVTIAENRFIGKGGDQPAINIRVSIDFEKLDAPENLGRKLMRNLTMRDNQFENLVSSAIRLRGVSGVTIENNRVIGSCDTVRALHPFFTDSATAIDMDYCCDVTVKGLMVEDPLFKTDLRIGKLMGKKQEDLCIQTPDLRIRDER